jgi:hypothetical protein
MVAELTQVHGPARRWRFALGVVRILLLPPVAHRGRAIAVAAAGLAVTAGATVLARQEVPGLAVCVATLGLLLCGYATVAVARSRLRRPSVAGFIVAAVAVAALAGTLVAVSRVARAHPTATADGTHVYSILFAAALAGYLIVALALPRSGERSDTPLWWALAATIGDAATWIGIALTVPATASGVVGLVSPVAAVAVLAASIGAAATGGGITAGLRGGVLTLALSAPAHFAIDVTAMLAVRQYTLTDPYDIAKFAQGRYPDVASFVLSDALGGQIIAGLLLYPVMLFALATLGATAGTHLRAYPRRALS